MTTSWMIEITDNIPRPDIIPPTNREREKMCKLFLACNIILIMNNTKLNNEKNF